MLRILQGQTSCHDQKVADALESSYAPPGSKTGSMRCSKQRSVAVKSGIDRGRCHTGRDF
jgi:hypothetical protein